MEAIRDSGTGAYLMMLYQIGRIVVFACIGGYSLYQVWSQFPHNLAPSGQVSIQAAPASSPHLSH